MSEREVPEPIGWMTRDATWSLKQGGNSRGTAAVHPLPTRHAKIGVYTATQMREAIAQAVADEREAWELAMTETWQMVDPLRPPPAGSYALGSHNGICDAMRSIRMNLDYVRRKRSAGPWDRHPMQPWIEALAPA